MKSRRLLVFGFALVAVTLVAVVALTTPWKYSARKQRLPDGSFLRIVSVTGSRWRSSSFQILWHRRPPNEANHKTRAQPRDSVLGACRTPDGLGPDCLRVLRLPSPPNGAPLSVVGPSCSRAPSAEAWRWIAVALPVPLGGLAPFALLRRPVRPHTAVVAWCGFVTALLFWTAAGALSLGWSLG